MCPATSPVSLLVVVDQRSNGAHTAQSCSVPRSRAHCSHNVDKVDIPAPTEACQINIPGLLNP